MSLSAGNVHATLQLSITLKFKFHLGDDSDDDDYDDNSLMWYSLTKWLFQLISCGNSSTSQASIWPWWKSAK